MLPSVARHYGITASTHLQAPGRAREEYLDLRTAASPRCLDGIPNTPGKARQLVYRQLTNNRNTKEELQAMLFYLSFSSSVGEQSTK
jgi:hypothetical protein